MSNKHQTNHLEGVALRYLKTELPILRNCPRGKCEGTMTIVWVRYQDHGPINLEQECTICGKTIKDPRYKRDNRKWRPKYKK